MTDHNGSDESLNDIILECKQRIQQLDKRLEELSILFSDLIFDDTEDGTLRSPNGELADEHRDDPKD